ALQASGTVQCWGRADTGVLGRVDGAPAATPGAVPGIERAIAISVGDEHACAIDEDGVIRCWGTNTLGQVGGTDVGVNAPTEVELWCGGRDDEAQLADGESGTGGEAPPRRALRTPPGGP